jgi:hypothetical protein
VQVNGHPKRDRTLNMLLERLDLEVNMNIMYNCGFEMGER